MILTSLFKRLALTSGVLASGFLALSFSVAQAEDGSDRPEFSANVALTTDYVFRGFSQTEEGPAIQGGFDMSYRMLYVGVWASNLDFGSDNNGNDIANIEIDVYAGIKHKFGAVEADLGVIYYAYPGAEDAGNEFDYVEIKFGLSGDLNDRVSLSGTIYYSPEYFGETGETLTYEGGVSVELGTYGGFSPTFSATYGYTDFLDTAFSAGSYAYWNAGVEIGFLEKFALDLRYWDTDVSNVDNADERFVATVSSSW